MCQGEPGPPATPWPVPYGPTLLVSAAITPTAPWGPKLRTLPLQSGQTPGYLQGPSVPALYPGLAVQDGRAQAKPRKSASGEPPSLTYHHAKGAEQA